MNSTIISKQKFSALKQKFKFFGRAEIDELEKIIVPGESILEVLNGFYSGGFAVLCATNLRLLLVDKKPFILTVEDVRYDMINEIDYHGRLLDATAVVHTPSKSLQFTSWHQRDLRSLVTFVQRHIIQLRQQSAAQAMATHPVYVPVKQEPVQVTQPVASIQPVARVEASTFDEASMRRLAYILRRPRIGKFILGQ